MTFSDALAGLLPATRRGALLAMGLSSLLNSFKRTAKDTAAGTNAEPQPPTDAGKSKQARAAGRELPIAVEFGTGALKVLQVDGAEPPTLIAAAKLDIPPEIIHDAKKRWEFQLAALGKLVKKGGFKGKRAVCAIPAWRTSVKHLQFPRTEGVPIASLVEAAIPSQLGVDPTSLVYRFIEVNSDRPAGKVDVILISVQREVVDQLMMALVDAKLEPVGMHSEFLCSLRAFDHLHRREGDLLLNTLYIDIGATNTKVMIAHGRDLVFARLISVGGHNLDEAIAQQAAVTQSQARRMRYDLDSIVATTTVAPRTHESSAAAPENDRRKIDTPDGFSGDVLAQPQVPVGPTDVDLAEPLEILTDEIRLCLRYHASQFPSRKVERVVFVGGEAKHRGLTQYLARALRLPAQVADPLARVARTGKEPVAGLDMKQAQPGWAVALGLCLAPTDL
jgi:type IV pilus assembly protein PilM